MEFVAQTAYMGFGSESCIPVSCVWLIRQKEHQSYRGNSNKSGIHYQHATALEPGKREITEQRPSQDYQVSKPSPNIAVLHKSGN